MSEKIMYILMQYGVREDLRNIITEKILEIFASELDKIIDKNLD